MYLKRLDLQGFKSFPEKVKLDFNKGITAVVGPNGSGKSNISDSVRWVLGEQKAKTLRGDKMEDIIFAGTESRKALGFAEVSITIDNKEGKMPIEYTEVTVTRRVYRSGESEYLINGTNCRLKDIHELFMDTGIGREGYSIIGQGKIDEILSSKSDDRRRLFEEAAGIVKFKNRRQETFLKLEKEQQNLERAEDIINELESQIEPLKNQSETAKKYISLKEKLKYCDINIFKFERNRIDSEIKDIGEKLEIYNQSVLEKEKEGESIRDNIHSLKKLSDEYTDDIQNINDNIAEKRSSLEKLESSIKIVEEQIAHSKSNIERAKSDKAKAYEAIEKNKESIDIEKSKITASEISLKAHNDKLSVLEEKFSNLSNALTENESIVDEYKTEMIEKIKTSTELKGDISKAESMESQYKRRKEQLENEKAYIESQIRDSEIHIEALKKHIEVNGEKQQKLEKEISNSDFERKNILNNNDIMRAILQTKEREYNDKKSRLNVLSDMEKEHEGFFKSVKSILKLSSQGDRRFKGVMGAVGEIFTVDKKYETAIEIALGGAMQNIVTDNEDSAKSAIEYLKHNNLGRATFLPISAVKGKGIEKDRDKILSEKGIIGTADTIVNYENVYDGIAKFLLGKVIIAENIDFAIEFSKKYKYSYKIVTLDGDTLSVGGAMTGGSISKKSTGIFGRSREIKELKDYIEVFGKEVDEIRNKISEGQKKIDKIAEKVSEMNMALREISLKNENAKNDISRTENSLKDKNEKLNLYIIEEKQLKEQSDFANTDLEKAKEKLLNTEKDIERINEVLSKYQTDIESERVSQNQLLNEITEIKITVSNIKQSRKNSDNTIKRINDTIKELEKDIENFDKDKEKLKKDIENKKEGISKTEVQILEVKRNIDELQKNLTEKADMRKDTIEKYEGLEEKIRECSDYIAKLKNDSVRIEARRDKLFEDKERIANNIIEEYDINPETIENTLDNLPSVDSLKKSAYNLKGEIKALGSVNVDAIEKYREVKERYTFLCSQRDDIVEAERKLKGIISELTTLMENQFKEQFEIISNNFNETFREMFGGGKAYLRLSDENDVLGSGIDIIAQPPGKNLQNMMLLSGGERALTAISILFSILKMKPSPFCILDEIEAALDDANVKRYADYLRKFSKETQFIVITHRKGTMEAADVMYGITMQEKGVSKLISVDFTDTMDYS